MGAWLSVRWMVLPGRVQVAVVGSVLLVVMAFLPLWAWLVFPALFVLIMLGGMASAAVEIVRDSRRAPLPVCCCDEDYVCTVCDPRVPFEWPVSS